MSVGKDIGLSDQEEKKLRYIIVQPIRFAIVDLIRKKGRKYIAEISSELSVNRKVVSYHLRRLEKVGLVITELERTPSEVGNPVLARYVYLTELTEKILNSFIAS